MTLNGHVCQRGHEPEADAVSLQFKEYLERAEYVKSLLDGQQPAEPSANGATGQKMKPGGGGGGGDKDVSATCPLAMPCRVEIPVFERFACLVGWRCQHIVMQVS